MALPTPCAEQLLLMVSALQLGITAHSNVLIPLQALGSMPRVCGRNPQRPDLASAPKREVVCIAAVRLKVPVLPPQAQAPMPPVGRRQSMMPRSSQQHHEGMVTDLVPPHQAQGLTSRPIDQTPQMAPGGLLARRSVKGPAVIFQAQAQGLILDSMDLARVPKQVPSTLCACGLAIPILLPTSRKRWVTVKLAAQSHNLVIDCNHQGLHRS